MLPTTEITETRISHLAASALSLFLSPFQGSSVKMQVAETGKHFFSRSSQSYSPSSSALSSDGGSGLWADCGWLERCALGKPKSELLWIKCSTRATISVRGESWSGLGTEEGAHSWYKRRQKMQCNAMKGISHNFKLKVGHIGSSFIFSASHIIYIWGKSLATYLFCISLSFCIILISLSPSAVSWPAKHLRQIKCKRNQVTVN